MPWDQKMIAENEMSVDRKKNLKKTFATSTSMTALDKWNISNILRIFTFNFFCYQNKHSLRRRMFLYYIRMESFLYVIKCTDHEEI